MKKNTLLIVLLISIFFTSSCDILNQVVEASQLAQCKFNIQNTQNLTIAGINMQNKNSFSDFSFQDALKLTNVLTSNRIPAEITINLKAKNPNSKTAGMNRLAWTLLLDNQQITNGVVNERINIPANGSSTIPMTVAFDLRKLFSGKSKDSFMNLINSLTGKNGKGSKVALKLVPSIKVGNQLIDYPGNITVNHTIGK